MLKNNILKIICEMEADDSAIEDALIIEKKRKKCKPMYLARIDEGAFGTLFQSYLSYDEKLFQRYLRLPPQMFYSLLNSIENDLQLASYNRNKTTISPTQQLCLTLR